MTISEKELIKLISKNIKEKPENININSKRSEFKNWDSLTNVRIIMELQNRIGKNKDLSHLMNFKNIKELLKKINI